MFRTMPACVLLLTVVSSILLDDMEKDNSTS